MVFGLSSNMLWFKRLSSFIIYSRVQSDYLLHEKCNLKSPLFYDNMRPIQIQNKQSLEPNGSFENCKLIINATMSLNKWEKMTFMIRVDTLDCANSSSLDYIKIADHSAILDVNVSILNETNVCEMFNKVNFILIESACFEIGLTRSNSSSAIASPFSSIASITITWYTSTEKSNLHLENTFREIRIKSSRKLGFISNKTFSRNTLDRYLSTFSASNNMKYMKDRQRLDTSRHQRIWLSNKQRPNLFKGKFRALNQS